MASRSCVRPRPACGGCTCACITDEFPFEEDTNVVVFPLGPDLPAPQRILPPTQVSLSCPSCMDIVFAGSLYNVPPEGTEGLTVDVTLQLLVSNNATPDLYFGLSEAAAPTVTLTPGVLVPISVRYVTCQPPGSYSVFLQFTTQTTAGLGAQAVIAYGGALTIASSKC
jgi:hypothetical protein